MMKRSAAIILAAGLCCALVISVLASGGMAETGVRVTAFEDYTAEGGSLTSDMVTVSDQAALFEEADDGIRLTGVIPGEKKYDISAAIADGRFTGADEKNGNYTILSVIAFGDIVRVILGDNDRNNIYYIEFGSDSLTSIKPYRVNWYHDFLSPGVEADDSTTGNDKEFSVSAVVFGDKYEEILVLRSSNDWDDPVSAGAGYSVISSMRLLSKTTEITRAGSSAVTTAEGNSLFADRISYTAVSPYGEYFRKIDARFDGDNGKEASAVISAGVSTPDRPLFIDDLSLAEAASGGAERTAAYLDTAGGSVPMAVMVEYTAPGIRLDEAADGIVIESSLKTHDDYIKYGRKELVCRWDYHVSSVGSGGAEAAAISVPQYFRIYYTLEK